MNYVVLGTDESCTGDPARRSGNEFLFQMMAAQTKELLDGVFEGREPGTRKIVTTCPHCFNTLGREYPQLGAATTRWCTTPSCSTPSSARGSWSRSPRPTGRWT